MSTEFDLYVRRNTWIHRLDPRVKLLFVVEASAFLFIWPTIWAALGVIVFCNAAFWLAEIPARSVGRIYRTMLPLAGLVFILTAIFGDGAGPSLVRVGRFGVASSAVYQGAMLGLRLLALALVVFLWLFTTDQTAMVRGFAALRIRYEWALTLALAPRYLPIFSGLFGQVREAQQARGLDLEQRSLRLRLRAYRPVLVAMVINALRQSERLGWALEARAMGARGVKRTVFRPLRLASPDYLALAALALALVIGVTFRLL